jgi:RimJ/RimL family protein N-acetyltransferase
MMEIRQASDADLAALVTVLGQRRLAIGVGLDNPNARRLYERLGYADWGHGTLVATWQERDHDGPPVTLSETLDILVKQL